MKAFRALFLFVFAVGFYALGLRFMAEPPMAHLKEKKVENQAERDEEVKPPKKVVSSRSE